MRLLRIERLRGTALVGAILVACGLGCGSRPLVDDRDAGAGGSAGAPGDPGRGGTGGNAGRGGAGGNAGRGGFAVTGRGGSGGTTPPGIEHCPIISCGAGPCAARAGQPRVLVTSPHDHQIGAIAVGGDTLYWGTLPSQLPGELRSMPLAGGPSTLLAANVVVSDLYLDGSTLYYVNNDRFGGSALVAIPATGGTFRVVATGEQISQITSDASGIYFGQGGVMRADRAGSSVTPVVTSTAPFWGFAVDETNVYWASYANGGALYRRALAGGDTTTLRVSSRPITHPIVVGDDIYFVEGIVDTCDSAVWAVSKTAGGAARLISPGTSGTGAWRLVRDGGDVYWGRSAPQGALLRTVKGQTPEILVADQLNVASVFVGVTDVYWIATTSDFSTYEVRSLPK